MRAFSRVNEAVRSEDLARAETDAATQNLTRVLGSFRGVELSTHGPQIAAAIEQIEARKQRVAAAVDRNTPEIPPPQESP